MASQVLASLAPQQGDSIQTLLARLIGTEDRGTLLASAARTASVTANLPSPVRGRRAAVLFWDITSVSGSGGLTLALQMLDPVSLKWLEWGFAGIFTATGSRIVTIGSGYASAGISLNQGMATQFPLSSNVRVRVSHSDASSYTYSLGYELL